MLAKLAISNIRFSKKSLKVKIIIFKWAPDNTFQIV